MAEEHIVLPRERYQRMLDQMAEKKQGSAEERDNSHQEGEKTNEQHDRSTPEDATSDSQGSSDLERTRDDVKEAGMRAVEHRDMAPPGITPGDLKKLVDTKRKKTLKTKSQRQTPRGKSTLLRYQRGTPAGKKFKRKPASKALAHIKKNWVNIV